MMLKKLQSKIKEWKAKYGQIFHIVIPVDDKTNAEFIVRKPDKSELSAMSAKEDPSDYNELMFNIMILDGDRKYIDETDDFLPDVYLGVINELGKLYQPKKATSTSL